MYIYINMYTYYIKHIRKKKRPAAWANVHPPFVCSHRADGPSPRHAGFGVSPWRWLSLERTGLRSFLGGRARAGDFSFGDITGWM